MTAIPNKKRIAKAMQDNAEKFDFNKRVIASQDFGYMLPVECKLCFPGDRFDINVSQFTRLEGLPAPTFGKIECVTRSFFVPMHQLFKDWENFIRNQKAPSSSNFSSGFILRTACVPKMTVLQLSNFFLHSGLFAEFVAGGFETIEGIKEDYACDIISMDFTKAYDGINDHLDHVEYSAWNVKPLGRKILSLLNGLGYNFPWFSSIGISSDPDSAHFVLDNNRFSSETWDYYKNANVVISALPLLAFWKFYLDWCVPSRYIRDGFIKLYNVLDLIYKQDSQCFITDTLIPVEEGQLILSNRVVSRLLHGAPLSFFSDDIFSQAFKSPFGYEDNMSNSISIANPADNWNEVDDNYPPTAVDAVGSSPRIDAGFDYINMFSLHSLGALQDLVNRGKLAGSKIQDYLRATYGFTPSDDGMNVSKYLGSHRFDIQIGDVMSNADTKSGSSGAYLGEYAGRGLGGSTCHYSFETKEHGFYFITSELYVRPSYPQGLRPECSATQRVDFFEPALDNMQCEAIKMNELMFTPLNYRSDHGNDVSCVFSIPEKIFGFVPTYAKYKTNFDSILGDFRLGRVNTGLDSWYLSRLFTNANAVQWSEGINYLFSQQAGADGLQNYDRIFNVANNTIDHFKTVFNLEFTAYRHMKSLVKPFEAEENHGSDVEVSEQGVV